MTLPPRFERVVAAVGELARPGVLYLASGSSAIATVSIVWMRLDLLAGAAFVAAVWSGVAVLYGAKAAEVAAIRKRDSEVEIARAASPSDLHQGA